MRWIIGDIHGMRAPLERLLEEVARVDAQAQFYFVGDYVNHGPDAKGELDLLLSLSGAKFVRGNHDDIFDQVLNSTANATDAANGDRMVAFEWFIEHGLDNTFMSYGVDYAMIESGQQRPTAEKLFSITSAVP